VCTTCTYCYSCHYKIELREKESEMKMRPLRLIGVNSTRSTKTVHRQPKYQVNFITYKIAH
jgi:hypothetical protein